MTLQPQNSFSIPEETARVARSAFPKGNLYMKMRDALGTIYQDQAFAHVFPDNGRPAEARFPTGVDDCHPVPSTTVPLVTTRW